MKNRYYANVILCQKVKEDFSIVSHPFDNLETTEKVIVPFEIFINLSYDIKVEATVTFVIGIHYEGRYRPISILKKNVREGIWGECSKYSVKDFEPIGEGSYIFEIRYGENIDFNVKVLDESNVEDLMDKTNVLNRYVFTVDFK